MKKASFATDEFPWTEDDFCYDCVVGKYRMSITDMGKNIYACVLSRDGILVYNGWKKGKYIAIGFLEGLYMGYDSSN